MTLMNTDLTRFVHERELPYKVSIMSLNYANSCVQVGFTSRTTFIKSSYWLDFSRRPQDRGDRGRSKVTFSKTQKVPLEDGGEFSCDAGISEDTLDASSSQEFENATYTMGITWDRFGKQCQSHEYPALSIVKNSTSHPLQQIQNGTPDAKKKSRKPIELLRKYTPSFKKTYITRRV